MKTIVATLNQNCNLEKYADAINNGRNDNIYFYVNGSNVTVSHTYANLSIDEQLIQLQWFLTGKDFTITQ